MGSSIGTGLGNDKENDRHSVSSSSPSDGVEVHGGPSDGEAESKSTVGPEHHGVRWLKLVEFRGSSLCGCIWLLNFMSVKSVPASVEGVCHHGAVSNAVKLDL